MAVGVELDLHFPAENVGESEEREKLRDQARELAATGGFGSNEVGRK